MTAGPVGPLRYPVSSDGVADPAQLRARWAALAGPSAAARTVGDGLITAWGEPHRRYHDLGHLAAVLDHLDDLDGDGTGQLALGAGGTLTASGAARTAAWFHDAVYRPGAADNETASAARAEVALGSIGWGAEAVGEVVRLVLLTAEHRGRPADRPGALLCDADLAVLGAGVRSYERYVAAVRAEYVHVDADGWRRGRGAVLRSLLERDRLYLTGEGAARWEAQARRNLATELAALTA